MYLTDLRIWSKRILPLLYGFEHNELMDEPLFLKVRPVDAVLYEADQIEKVVIDEEGFMADINRTNNSYPREEGQN